MARFVVQPNLGPYWFRYRQQPNFPFLTARVWIRRETKNEDVEARKLGASNLLPFAVQTTNHYPTARRSLEGGALAGITILPRLR